MLAAEGKKNVTFATPSTPSATSSSPTSQGRPSSEEPRRESEEQVRIEVEEDDDDDDDGSFAPRNRKDEENEKAALLRMRFNSESEGGSGKYPNISDESEGDDDNDEDERTMRGSSTRYDPQQQTHKGCAAEMGEYLQEMGEDLAANLGYMKDSLLTKEGWLLTLRRIKADWRAAGTVGLVNLPLSISLAVAADSGPVAGVSTAIWAGLFTSLFGGCVYNIVGPTGALSGILATNVSLYGVDSLPYLAILTGIICLIVFLLKWERYVLLVPSSVMEGFTVGVAFIIALNQINFALGLGEIPRHESFIHNIIESLRYSTETDPWSLGLFLLSVTSLYSLMMTYRKIPWVIVLCTLGIILGYSCSHNYIPFRLQTLQTRYGDLEFELVSWPEFKLSYITIDFFSSALSIAFVALLETLISAKIADTMTKTTFNQRKEVFGLGLANIVTGVVGGIPATAALARTALNINTGATSRMAGILQSVFVLLLSFFLLTYFKYLPLPIVAAVIVIVAIRMVDHHHIVRFWKMDKTVFFLTFFVAAICVVVEPTSGIVVGMVLALLMFSDMTSRIHSELVMTDDDGSKKFVSDKEIQVGEVEKSKRERKKKHLQELKGVEGEDQEAQPIVPRSEVHKGKNAAVYRISGQLTYINGFAHKKRLLMFRSCDCIVISLRYLYYIDIDGLDALHEVIEQLEKEGKLVLLSGVNLGVSALISKADWFLQMVSDGKVFATYMDALASVEGGDDVELGKIVNVQNF
jgi:SulP family sulfate permease